jgi:hypothetical protein
MNVKSILTLFLLIVLCSCCKEDELPEITANWNVGIYNDIDTKAKHLTFEIMPSKGYVEAVSITVNYIFTNGQQTTTLTFKDSDFNLSHINTIGIYGVTWTPVNYLLDDYTWRLQTVYIKGRIKIKECWYSFSARRTY